MSKQVTKAQLIAELAHYRSALPEIIGCDFDPVHCPLDGLGLAPCCRAR